MKTIYWALTIGICGLLAASCNKEDRTASTPMGPEMLPPGPIPPPYINPMNPRAIPQDGLIVNSLTDNIYDNSRLASQPVMKDRVYSKTLLVKNFDPLLIPNPPTQKIENGQWVPFDAEQATHLFAPCASKSKLCLDTVAAEMVFQFDNEAILNFKARINQKTYKAAKIPYSYDSEKGRLRIAQFYALSEQAGNNPAIALQMGPLKHSKNDKIVTIESANSKTVAFEATLVNLAKPSCKEACVGKLDSDIFIAFRINERLALRFFDVPANVLAGTPTAQAVPAPAPAPQPVFRKVIQSPAGFVYAESRYLDGIIRLEP